MAPSQEDDPDIAALRRAAAAKRNKTLIIVAAVVLSPVLYWASGFGSVRSSLEGDGFTDVRVSASGPFDYGFEAKKGNSECKGNVTRLPFSTSQQSFCYSVDASGRGTGSTGVSNH